MYWISFQGLDKINFIHFIVSLKLRPSFATGLVVVQLWVHTEYKLQVKQSC